MQRRGARLLGGLVLLLSWGTPALEAQLTTSWNGCGGNVLATCAAVELVVDGTQVTVRTRNLSGLSDTDANTVFTGLGFEFMDPSLKLAAESAGSTVDYMSGPVIGSPEWWEIHNDKQIGGGVKLDLVGTTPDGVDNGIASELATSLPGGTNDFWVSGESQGWVTFSFRVQPHELTQADLDGTSVLVKGQNGPDGESTQLILPPSSVVPEPVSMALLGTGLAGVGYMRRRRNRGETGDREEI